MSLYTTPSLRVPSAFLEKKEEDLLMEQPREFMPRKTYDIFLSHSFQDAELIITPKRDIERKGYSVYVDWVEDARLDRSNVTPESVELLRTRLRSCKGLIYVATQEAAYSSWMPWKFGFPDGEKGIASLHPIIAEEIATNAFDGKEYLGVYPCVSGGTQPAHRSRSALYVHEDETTCVSYRMWLQNLNPFQQYISS